MVSRKLGKAFLSREFKLFGFGSGWGSHSGSKFFLIVNLSFFIRFAHEPSSYSHFSSRPPFWVFALESHFSSSFFSFFFSLIDPSYTWKFKILPEQVNNFQDIFGLKNKDNSLIGYKKKFSKKYLFSLSIHVWSKWTFQVRNVGQVHSFERNDKLAQIVF